MLFTQLLKQENDTFNLKSLPPIDSGSLSNNMFIPVEEIHYEPLRQFVLMVSDSLCCWV